MIKKATIFFGSLLYPVYTLPFIISSMFRNERFGYLMFSLFMGYLAYLMVPYDTMDITRHYETFQLLSSSSFSEIGQLGRSFDYAFYVYVWSMAHLGLPKEFIPFSVIFLIYSFYFLALKKVLDNTPARDVEKKHLLSVRALTILGVFLLFNEIRFVGNASGLRNPLAFSMFIYAIFELLYSKRRIKFLSLSIVATFIHISVLPVIIIFLATKWIRTLRLNRWLLIIAYVILLTGTAGILFSLIIKGLEPILRQFGLYFHAYMDVDGAWGLGFYEDKNIRTIVFEKILKPLPLYLAGGYFLVVTKYIQKDLARFLLLFFVFIALVSISRTMLDRYSVLFVMLFIYFLIIELQYKTLTSIKKLFLVGFVSALLLVDIGGLYKYRDIYWRSWGKALIMPMPIMLLERVEPNEYIIRHGGN